MTIQNVQIMVIPGDQPLLKSVYHNKYSILTKLQSRRSHLDLSDLSEMLVMKNSDHAKQRQSGFSVIQNHQCYFSLLNWLN